VIKTPKGLYIRTKKGRIYAVHTGNQRSGADGMLVSGSWRSESVTMPPVQQPSQSAGSTTSLLDPWGSSQYGVDSVYNSMPYYDTPSTPRETSMSSADHYSARYVPPTLTTHSGLSSSVISSDMSSDTCNVDPSVFHNVSMSYDGNFGWDSPVADQSMGNDVPFSAVQQQCYQNYSGFTVKRPVHQSSSCTDLPSDLLCIDASGMTDRTDMCDPTLPTLTIRHQHDDTDSLDSLTFNDCASSAYNRSSNVDPVFNGHHSSPYSEHSNINVTAPSSFSTATGTTGMLGVDDMSDPASDWTELSAMVNDAH